MGLIEPRCHRLWQLCGAREDGKCTLLSNTDFGKRACSFASPKLKTPRKIVQEMFEEGYSSVDIAQAAGIQKKQVQAILDALEKDGKINRSTRTATVREEVLERGW